MQTLGGKKALPLCILRVLRDNSDADHTLTHAEIIEKLASEYGISASRNAIARNLSLLMEMGYDISHGEKGRGAYLREREFDDMELRVLIDSVMTSHYIPEGDARRMIDKLASLSTRCFRSRIPHVHLLSSWNHQRNRQFFLNLELLWEAIELRKQVAFQYGRVLEDGILHPTRPEKSVVHPHALLTANAQYYLIASVRSRDDLTHFRVDRMTDVDVLSVEARPTREIPQCAHGLDIGRYAQEHILMFGGPAETVVYKMDRMNASDVLDAFGSFAQMEKLDETYMKVTVRTSLQGARFFALQFSPVCEVLAPESLKEAVRSDVRELMDKYYVK